MTPGALPDIEDRKLSVVTEASVESSRSQAPHLAEALATLRVLLRSHVLGDDVDGNHARGLSREIAVLLVISSRTARNHIEHIYVKIGASNRADAGWFVRHGLLPDGESAAH